MLLPVFIQHRRLKKVQSIVRRKELRRLSLTITPDNPNLLSQISENATMNFKQIPIHVELVSFPSTKTILDDIDDNDNVTFTLQQKFQPFVEKYDDSEESGITADDCIAHLLDSTPWSSYPIKKSPMVNRIKRKSREILKEQHLPIITTFHSNDQQSAIQSNPYYTVDFFRTNPTFTESDV